MGKKILVIEDDMDAASLLISRLISSGYDAKSAPDATFATKELHEYKPDLILLDMMLPAGGGLGVLERMNLSVYTKRIPVIMITGGDIDKYMEQAKGYNIKGALKKPFEAKDLIEMVSKIFEVPQEEQPKKKKTLSKKILVVDDDPSIVDLLSGRLTASGYDVVTASDGVEALRQVDASKPDLIIADLMMPNLNGWQFSQKIKEREKKIPVILLSALVKDEGQSNEYEVGDYYLPKPFEAEKLMAKIKEFLK